MADLIESDDFWAWSAGRLGDGDGAEADVVARAIGVASTMITRWCRRSFPQVTLTNEPYDGDGSNTLRLRRAPIVSVASVTVNGMTLDPATYRIPVLASDAAAETNFNDDRIVLVAGVFPEGIRNVALSGVVGFAEIPPPIAEAARQLTVHLLAARGRDGTVQTEEVGDYRIARQQPGEAIPAAIRGLARPFRLPLPRGLSPSSYERLRSGSW